MYVDRGCQPQERILVQHQDDSLDAELQTSPTALGHEIAHALDLITGKTRFGLTHITKRIDRHRIPFLQKELAGRHGTNKSKWPAGEQMITLDEQLSAREYFAVQFENIIRSELNKRQRLFYQTLDIYSYTTILKAPHRGNFTTSTAG